MINTVWEALLLTLSMAVLIVGSAVYVGSCLIELYFNRKEEFVQHLMDKKQGACNGKN